MAAPLSSLPSPELLDEVLASPLTGWVIPGLLGGLTLEGHVWAALRAYRQECVRARRGAPLFTAGGSRRVLARSPVWLVRQYVSDNLQRSAFARQELARAAAAVYRDALQARCAAVLVELVLGADGRTLRQWRVVLDGLGVPCRLTPRKGGLQ